MCTLAVAWKVDRRWPLVVAANRDERLGRPSEGWALRDGRDRMRYAAPRDLEAGGTWMGLNQRGLFAAITNYRLPAGPGRDPSKRSRGDLVGRALEAASAAEARSGLSSLDAGRYNPFHLLVADRETAFLCWFHGEGLAFEPLGPGLHLVTENSPHGRCPRGEAVRSRWPLEPAVPRLRGLLAEHSVAPLTGTCIHLDPHYGTRSSAVLRLSDSLRHSELHAADGRPCQAPLEDRSELLESLGRSS